MKNTEIIMNKNKPVYLGISILELSKILINEFWYDYSKQDMVKMQKFVIWIKMALLFM